jgi:hypothetical protein
MRTGRSWITPAETRSGPAPIGQPGCGELERQKFTSKCHRVAQPR